MVIGRTDPCYTHSDFIQNLSRAKAIQKLAYTESNISLIVPFLALYVTTGILLPKYPVTLSGGATRRKFSACMPCRVNLVILVEDIQELG